jgi:hypothetical protein
VVVVVELMMAQQQVILVVLVAALDQTLGMVVVESLVKAIMVVLGVL